MTLGTLVDRAAKENPNASMLTYLPNLGPKWSSMTSVLR
jgi:hypothetical protein